MRIKDLATRATKLLAGNSWFAVDNGSKVDKVGYSDMVKEAIEEYNVTSLAGSNQSVKSAVDALNSNQTYNSGQTIYIGGSNAMYAGRIGWGGLEIWVTIPIDKPIASNVTTATLTLNGSIYACTGTQAVQFDNKISEVICQIGVGGRNFLSICFKLSSNPLTVSDAGLNVMFSGTLSEVALS